jgi:hypothetical protein
VTSERSFIAPEQWDQCIHHDVSPELAEPSLQVFVGIEEGQHLGRGTSRPFSITCQQLKACANARYSKGACARNS